MGCFHDDSFHKRGLQMSKCHSFELALPPLLGFACLQLSHSEEHLLSPHRVRARIFAHFVLSIVRDRFVGPSIRGSFVRSIRSIRLVRVRSFVPWCGWAVV